MATSENKRVKEIMKELKKIKNVINAEKDKLTDLYEEIAEMEYCAGISIYNLGEAIDTLDRYFE